MEIRKTALVLGGGGARGAYEIGVWQALRELGIKIDIITGTSVGAINGALIVQDTFDLAVSLWKEIETPMIFDIDIKDIIANSGVGTSKLKDLLTRYIDEPAVRKSPIEFGLVTLELPSMAPKYIMKDQIPHGMLIDYILASSSLFPAMKTYQINSLKYVDGGFTDNMPVGLAVDHGATHVIAVDLETMGVIRKDRLNDADFLKIIQCPWDLGNILIFDKINSRRIMRLGYLDAMKTFQVFDGSSFCFVKGEFDSRSLKGATEAGLIFELDPEIIYKKYIYDLHLKKAVESHVKSLGKDTPTYSDSILDKIQESIVQAKTTLSQKTLTMVIVRSLKQVSADKNIFLSKTAMKLLREEILAANYLIREGLVS